MKTLLVGLLVTILTSVIGCDSAQTTTEAVETKENEIIEVEIVEEIEEVIEEVIEEYVPQKHYEEGDICVFEGELLGNSWDSQSTNSYILSGYGVILQESKKRFSMRDICEEIGYEEANVKIVAEFGDYIAGSGIPTFYIKSCEIVDFIPIDLGRYCSERASMEKEGLDTEEVAQLKKWCEENEYCKQFEESMEVNIYNLYE